jgi:N-sulfoglucosamine sulfohydrolase
MKWIVSFMLVMLSLSANEKMNVVLLTVDDMNADSLGAFGCPVEGTSPQFDAFAEDAMRFNYAHVHATSCIPSRNIISSGKYLYNSGLEGFYQLPKDQVTFRTLPEVLQANGYFTMIRGKAHHSYPYVPYKRAFDIIFDDELKEKKLNIRQPKTFYDYTKKGVEAARKACKPFFYSMDIHDPHTPYYGLIKKKLTVGLNKEDKNNAPSRIFKAEEIVIPPFLPQTDIVRLEMAAYYSTVRRADDSIGNVIQALKDSGVYDQTIIVFLSDHGMPEPFGKTTNYYNGSHTPLTVRWPGHTKAGSVDNDHMIGSVDIFPSVLEMLGIEQEKDLDGRSFTSILEGNTQEDRDYVLTMYEENVGGNRQPTRSIISKDFAYIYNLWSDGERKFSSATKGTLAYKEMERLAKEGDAHWQARLDMYNFRQVEELYNYHLDPHALKDLSKNPEYANKLDDMRHVLAGVMKASSDPLYNLFLDRANHSAIEAHLAKVDAESDTRRRDAVYSRSGKAKIDKKKSSDKKKKAKK